MLIQKNKSIVYNIYIQFSFQYLHIICLNKLRFFMTLKLVIVKKKLTHRKFIDIKLLLNSLIYC